jgi:hypothetical protein
VARTRLLERVGIELLRVRVLAVERARARWRVSVAGGERFTADAVVLALGGIVSGGIALDRADNQVKHGGFRPGVAAPLTVHVKGQPSDSVASLHGFDFTEYGLSVLSRVGALPNADARALRVAGDLMAGRPNTALQAVWSGSGAAAELCAELASGG